MKYLFVLALLLLLISAAAAQEQVPIQAICMNGRLVGFVVHAPRAGSITLAMPSENPCAPPAPPPKPQPSASSSAGTV